MFKSKKKLKVKIINEDLAVGMQIELTKFINTHKVVEVQYSTDTQRGYSALVIYETEK